MNLRPYLIGGAVGVVLGLLLGWLLWHPVSKLETAAPAKPLSGGAVMVERAPNAAIPPDVKTAAAEAGGKLERAGSVTVQPRPVQTSAEPACSCGPVTFDWGLVAMPDDTQRVVATSPDGKIVSAIDIPGALDLRPSEPRWEAGVLVNPLQPTEAGAIVLRSAGPFRLGAAAIHLEREGWVPFAVATLKLR